MIVLAVAAFSWRLLAMPAPVDRSIEVRERKSHFHENWAGGLSLGLVATVSVVNTFVSELVAATRGPFPGSIDWPTVVYSVSFRPAQLIWLAAALGGFALASLRWRQRLECECDVLPRVDGALFAIIMVSLLVFFVASAPILGATSFSCWFVLLR